MTPEPLCKCGHPKDDHNPKITQPIFCQGSPGCTCVVYSPAAPSPSTREALPTTAGSVIEATARNGWSYLWLLGPHGRWVADNGESTQPENVALVRVLFDAGATREPVPTQLTDEEKERLVDAMVMTPLSDYAGTDLTQINKSVAVFVPVVASIVAARLSASTDRAEAWDEGHNFMCEEHNLFGRCEHTNPYRRNP